MDRMERCNGEGSQAVSLIRRFRKAGLGMIGGMGKDSSFIDMHRNKPWLLFVKGQSSLEVWNHEDGTRIAKWKVNKYGNLVSGRFFPKDDWILVMCEQSWVVYQYEAIGSNFSKAFLDKGDSSLLVDIAVHPFLPYLLMCANHRYDNVKLLNWEFTPPKTLSLDYTVLAGHVSGARMAAFHPQKSHIFASLSVAGEIMVWKIGREEPTQTIEGHPQIRNFQFCNNVHQSHLVTGGSGGYLRIWDYTTGACVANLTRNAGTVAIRSAFFHPRFPYIFSAGSDGIVRVWNELNYTPLLSYSSELENLWSMASSKQCDELVLGGDGTLLVLEVTSLENVRAEYETAVDEKTAEYERKLDTMTAEYERQLDTTRAEYERKLYERTEDYERAMELWQGLSYAAEREQETKKQLEERLEKEVNARKMSDKSNAEYGELKKSLLKIIEVEASSKRLLETSYERSKQRVGELEGALEAEIQARKVSDRSRAELEQNVTGKDERIHQLEAEREEMEKKLEISDERIAELEREGRLKEERIHQLEAERTELVEALSAFERKNGELEDRFDKEVDLRRRSEEARTKLEEEGRAKVEKIHRLEAEAVVLAKSLETARQKPEEVMESRLEKDTDIQKTMASSPEQAAIDRPFQEYSFSDLVRATENFSSERKLGEGDHHGGAYRGELHIKTPVIVKKLPIKGTEMSHHDDTQLKTQVVDKLRSLRHPHVLTLLGVCYGDERCLIYEHMRNGSVKEWLLSGKSKALPWYVRLRVMGEVARGLAFLHLNRTATGHAIIHCAVNPVNIFLDDNFVAKLGEVDETLLASDVSAGAQTPKLGPILAKGSQYVAPECFRSGIFDEKTDIYALGVTMLEMVTGKLCNAVGIVEGAIEDDAVFKTVLDQNAGDWDIAPARGVARLGLSCASLDRRQRPDMIGEGGGIVPSLEAVALKLKAA
ncbi:hypothetical protein CBR_g6491 [Chara braunii]|uniref:Protein kinase domain-containing protein n=1 Tax=Chara braunii TaxID=69332 RepID=A0A388KK72_CHABU|nr:hypothetical protein CBR_g6491 [Chara braunii]|eukprot:GBG70363.1 hypothetical protein CBR_g6491 [Chara braunii]